MTIKWTLRVAMAKKGTFTMAELGRRMAEKGGYPLTAPALHRLQGGKTRETAMDGKVCHACASAEVARRKGIPPAKGPEPQEASEERLLARFAPLRRAWVREFLASAYRRRSRKTRQMCLRALVRFDGFLAARADVGGGQWSLVGPEHVHAYLAEVGRFRLQSGKAFFTGLRSRKRVDRALVAALPDQPKVVRLRVLPAEQVAACYRRWTAAGAHPPDAQVADALERYLAWRARTYGGPSSYLLVSRASRLHNRPVSQVWFTENLLGVAVASLRQTAIQQLIQSVGCDGLEVAAHTALSLGAVGAYVRAFGRPR